MPLMRAYIRYFPISAGKSFVWSRIVDPYLAWEPRAFRARTAFGFHVEGDSKDLIQQWVYYFGIWEPALTTWIRRRLRRGDLFVDVGANIGYFALLASKAVGRSGRVVAIEASAVIFDSLRRNIVANGADNVRAIHAAAFGFRSTVRLYRGNDANCGETTIDEQYGGEFEADVQAFPLDDLLTLPELQSVRLIKIDTEGAEYSILAGFHALDRLRSDAELIVEVHPTYLAHRGESVEGILKLTAAAGFVPYVIKEEYWGPAYLQNGCIAQSPRRLTEPVTQDGAVLIFSRTDAAVLE